MTIPICAVCSSRMPNRPVIRIGVGGEGERERERERESVRG